MHDSNSCLVIAVRLFRFGTDFLSFGGIDGRGAIGMVPSLDGVTLEDEEDIGAELVIVSVRVWQYVILPPVVCWPVCACMRRCRLVW